MDRFLAPSSLYFDLFSIFKQTNLLFLSSLASFPFLSLSLLLPFSLSVDLSLFLKPPFPLSRFPHFNPFFLNSLPPFSSSFTFAISASLSRLLTKRASVIDELCINFQTLRNFQKINDKKRNGRPTRDRGNGQRTNCEKEVEKKAERSTPSEWIKNNKEKGERQVFPVVEWMESSCKTRTDTTMRWWWRTRKEQQREKKEGKDHRDEDNQMEKKAENRSRKMKTKPMENMNKWREEKWEKVATKISKNNEETNGQMNPLEDWNLKHHWGSSWTDVRDEMMRYGGGKSSSRYWRQQIEEKNEQEEADEEENECIEEEEVNEKQGRWQSMKRWGGGKSSSKWCWQQIDEKNEQKQQDSDEEALWVEDSVGRGGSDYRVCCYQVLSLILSLLLVPCFRSSKMIVAAPFLDIIRHTFSALFGVLLLLVIH